MYLYRIYRTGGMERIIECVPNFSEGRDRNVIDAIVAAIKEGGDGGVQVLDVDSGEAANRTVVTFTGSPEAVLEAAFQGVRKAAELIDMRTQKGTHPRSGATDVLPLIPIAGITLEECAVLARELTERIYNELDIPCYCYEAAAFRPERRNLAVCRAGEYEALPEKISDPERRPDFGPEEFTETAARSGAVNVGARDFLIAVNFNLNTESTDIAKEIAKDVREKGNGRRLKGCKAIGWYIKEYGIAQVSMNITDISATPLHVAYEEVCKAAECRGVKVTGTEIIGLVPDSSIIAAGKYFLNKMGIRQNITYNKILRIAINEMGLDELRPFNPFKKLIHTEPIDIVLPWVDGDDPVVKKDRLSYMNDGQEAQQEDVAGNSRYQSLGEIRYCIASINIFAPFIRKIFIVTDRQDPDLDTYLSEMFPEGHIPMEIIDHKVIFRGYEQYLPTFNSRAIETMIWRIPGLSERFILMNDDFIFTGAATPEDFFLGDKTVCYADWFSTRWAKLLRRVKSSNGKVKVGFKDSMLNALDVLGYNPSYFLCLGHTPRALRKSFFIDFYKDREDAIIRNINWKFRHQSQFNSQELFYMSEYRQKRCIQVPIRRKAMYMKSKDNGLYTAWKLWRFRQNTRKTFCCLNALTLASEKDQRLILEWTEDMLRQNLRKPL